ncbi:unnamed protein product [Danaus chrysippus]|uniref:(African queen) hypothetical protein n=1 Tax=Danaus chrysippus TaxID=151541 RepID=A0A8J2QUM7_9NEOP|nr:unnamed protein product [Danaus chrysippus]
MAPKPEYSRVKKCSTKDIPKLNFGGNFTHCHRHFDISASEQRSSLRQDILNSVIKRTQSIMLERDNMDNPLYEDPKDVIVEKPPKPPRKRNMQGIMMSPRKDGKSLKEQKRKLTKKYESLISALMDRCEESVVVITQKESQITKLREKLKTVLEYNSLFANENDRLKTEHTTLVNYIEECKEVIKEERQKNLEYEKKLSNLNDRVKHYEIPDKESSTIPLVEVCMSCSSRQIVLNQAREQNSRLQKDMQAMKDVLYRLNVQLSRYQERLRNMNSLDNKDVFKPTEKYNLDSLLTASLCQRQEVEESKSADDHTERLVDLSGLLSAQALAPLFDAYQENLQDKDNLILDYEKQFENMNKKSKQIVEENKVFADKVNALEEELVRVRQSYKKLMVEKETGDIERATMLERAEKAESKLKEVYELYEDKMSALMRDYETVHREYYALKCALKSSQRDTCRTVPADLHERRLDDCKRLLEELKHQYAIDSERKNEQIKKLEEDYRQTNEKYQKVCEENETIKEELRSALKNARLYRKAAVVFRHRARAAAARANRVRRKQKLSSNEPLKRALEALEKIKLEIKAVKTRAHSSLSELERRILHQEREAIEAQTQYRRDLERAELALRHKEGVIRNLVDKVADVEEVRLSQANAYRLQGIASDTSDNSVSPKQGEKKEKEDKKSNVKGYRENDKRNK